MKRGVVLYKLRPKHHYLWHIIDDLGSGINPRWMSCFAEEDLLGKLKKIGLKVHKNTSMRRMLERYLLYLTRRIRHRERSQCMLVSETLI